MTPTPPTSSAAAALGPELFDAVVDVLTRFAGPELGTIPDPRGHRAGGRAREPLAGLCDREREVLTLMAQGLTNGAIADELYLSVKTVESNISAIFTKLDLYPTERENRRVLAVLRFIEGTSPSSAGSARCGAA